MIIYKKDSCDYNSTEYFFLMRLYRSEWFFFLVYIAFLLYITNQKPLLIWMLTLTTESTGKELKSRQVLSELLNNQIERNEEL